MEHLALLGVLERARSLGALGPGPVEAHVDHARAFVAALADVDGPVLDLGSGAGIPGLVVAVARPDLEVVLLDAQERRVALLEEAVATLGLRKRVEVELGRAEVLGHRADLRAAVSAVTARSFGPPPVVAECAAPFLAVGGRLLVSEPPVATSRWPEGGLAQVGLELGPPSPGLAVLRQVQPCPDRFPRRVGVPAKRPLWSPG